MFGRLAGSAAGYCGFGMEGDGNVTRDEQGGRPDGPAVGAKGPFGPGLVRFVLLVLVLVLSGAAWVGSYAVTPLVPDATDSRLVLIPPRTVLPGIQRLLVEGGVIRDDVRFRILARLLGDERRLQAGEFRLSPGQTPLAILKILAAGRIVLRPVTIPEGASLAEIADILVAGGWVDRAEFLRLAVDPTFIRDDLRLASDSLEGYLFPDTYYLGRGQGPRDIVRMMVVRLRELLGEIGIDGKGSPAHGLTLHQLLTLASIVEKETAVAAERPLIARVFLNRLQKGMRLQTDPTVIYGLADFDGNLTRKDLREPTPYNTYLIKGLPPGPIASPGRAAIEAVLQPAEGAYLYFVSKNDGTHQFSSSLAEHNRAVRRYQKSPSRRGKR